MLRSQFFVCGLESFSFSAMQYGNRALDAVGESEPGQSFFDTTPASTRGLQDGLCARSSQALWGLFNAKLP